MTEHLDSPANISLAVIRPADDNLRRDLGDLTSLRRTRAGWTYVTIAATKADAGHDQAATRAAHAEKHPLRAGWWLDGIWPRAGSTPPWWGRTLHVEVGGRAVAGLVFENQALCSGPARAQRRGE